MNTFKYLITNYRTEVDATVPKKKKNEKLFDELIDVKELVGVDVSKIFKKAFLHKLEEMDVESVGFMFSPKGGVVIIVHNINNNQWMYLSMPALDKNLKNKILNYLNAEVVDNEK